MALKSLVLDRLLQYRRWFWLNRTFPFSQGIHVLQLLSIAEEINGKREFTWLYHGATPVAFFCFVLFSLRITSGISVIKNA